MPYITRSPGDRGRINEKAVSQMEAFNLLIGATRNPLDCLRDLQGKPHRQAQTRVEGVTLYWQPEKRA